MVTRTQGAALTTADDLTGDPRPRADGYHITAGSAALDAALGSPITTDIDAERRPTGPAPDVGADEYQFQVALTLAKHYRGPANVMGGTPLSYTLVVTNGTGSEIMPDVVVTDTVTPATAVSALFARAQGQPCAVNGAQVVCTLLNVPVGGAEAFTVWVTPTLAYSGRLTNTAALVALDAMDSAPADNVAGPVAVTVTAPLPDVWIAKAVAESYVAPGGTLHYTLTWGNQGVLPATNVVVTDTLPAGVTYQQASGNPTQNGQTLTWNVGTVAVGAGGSFVVTGAAGAGLPNWTLLVNRAGIRTSSAEPTLLNNHAVVTSTVSDTSGNAFEVTINSDMEAATIGEEVNFHVTVVNVGETQPYPRVEVEPNYPSARILPESVTSTPAGAHYDAASGKIVWDVLLAPGAEGHIYYKARVESCGVQNVSCGGVRHTAYVRLPGIPQPWSAARNLTIYCYALKTEQVVVPQYMHFQADTRPEEMVYGVWVTYTNLSLEDPVYGAIGKPVEARLILETAGGPVFLEADEPGGLPQTDKVWCGSWGNWLWGKVGRLWRW